LSLADGQSIAISMSICLLLFISWFVCPLTYLKSHIELKPNPRMWKTELKQNSVMSVLTCSQFTAHCNVCKTEKSF